MEIAPDKVGGVAILFAGLKILADHELKKPDRVVRHGVILIIEELLCKRKWWLLLFSRMGTFNARRHLVQAGSQNELYVIEPSAITLENRPTKS
jgi:hypothetical protein